MVCHLSALSGPLNDGVRHLLFASNNVGAISVRLASTSSCWDVPYLRRKADFEATNLAQVHSR